MREEQRSQQVLRPLRAGSSTVIVHAAGNERQAGDGGVSQPLQDGEPFREASEAQAGQGVFPCSRSPWAMAVRLLQPHKVAAQAMANIVVNGSRLPWDLPRALSERESRTWVNASSRGYMLTSVVDMLER